VYDLIISYTSEDLTMRTNIDIDDKLMDYVMATGEFKTKREAVEEGLRMLKRRRAYDGLLALQGKLHWDDSDEAWARRRAERAAELAVEEKNIAIDEVPGNPELSAPSRSARQSERSTKGSAA
jgi:antitoxin ParD1/3/4